MIEVSSGFWFAFGLLLVLDLLISAARPGTTSSSILRALGQGDSKDTNTSRHSPSMAASVHARASLFLAQGMLRFGLAGLILLLFSAWIGVSQPVVRGALVLMVAALLVAWLEWMVEERAKHNPQWSVQLWAYVRVWMFLLSPLVALTVPTGVRGNGSEPGVEAAIESEVKSLVDAGQQEGVFELDERKMIYSIFRLGDTLAREIMVPRIDLTAVDVRTPLVEAVDQLLRSGYSRIPVYEDNIDNILGVLYTKDLLSVWRQGALAELRGLVRPAYFVPEAKKVDELLAEMQNQRVHIAIVVDEYGGIAGLVTLEDIVEEIVGEIQDEFDQAEESPYQEIREGEYVFLGRVDVDDFNELMETNLPREEADTLGGFIYKQIGRVPTIGESLQVDNVLLTIEQVSGRRIRKVRAQGLPVISEKEPPVGGEKADGEP